MGIRKYENIVLNELNTTLNRIDENAVEDAIRILKKANKVFVLGLGRTGLMGKSFAMRLMHMGKDAYVIGETITPNLEEGDVLIVGSGSGETKGLVQMAEKAKSYNGKVIALTATANSTITKIADVSIVIQAPTKNKGESDVVSVQPMASLYEQSILLLCDSMILELMDMSEENNDEMFKRHSNLE